MSARSHLPKPLAEMYNENHTELEYEDLVETGKEVFSSIAVTMDEVCTNLTATLSENRLHIILVFPEVKCFFYQGSHGDWKPWKMKMVMERHRA